MQNWNWTPRGLKILNILWYTRATILMLGFFWFINWLENVLP